jgi:hypothetical protein
MITSRNINMQTPAYTITIVEIIEEFEKAKTRKDKKVVLEKYVDLDVLKNLFRGIYDPKVQWTINETPDYIVQEAPEGSEANTLYQEIPKCSIFVKGHPASAKLNPERTKQLLIQIMESLHSDEAALYMQMLKKKSKIKGLTSKLVLEVWPNLYKEKGA